jgi:hypothetical protein
MINGNPTNLCRSRIFLRQGCPLSPSLYILIVDSLRWNLEAEHILGCLPGIKISHLVKEINHSQFVDDTLLLGAASTIIRKRFKIMYDLLTALGGKINSSKRKIFG